MTDHSSGQTPAETDRRTSDDKDDNGGKGPPTTNAESPALNHSINDVEEVAQRLYRGVGLAPMVRASTTPLRALALQYGADFVYTEELVDRSLIQSQRHETLLVHEEEEEQEESSKHTTGNHISTKVPKTRCIDYHKDIRNASQKTLRKLYKSNGHVKPAPVLLRIDPALEQGRLICQLGTGEPELALQAALHVHRDVTAIDLNMGCPKKFSVSGGMGSALLSDVDRACRILKTLDGALTPLGVPVSAKIRLLKDTASTVDFVSALIHSGAKAVAIHGRQVGCEATKAADWETLREVVSIVTSKYSPRVPILLNGDFYTRKEFVTFQQETGASGVILARPALYNTSIFRPPMNVDDTDKFGYESPLLLDKTAVVRDYIRHAVRYGVHFKNTKYVVCEMMSNRRTPTGRVPFLPHVFPGGQKIQTVCDCRSLQDICQLWNVNYESAPAESMALTLAMSTSPIEDDVHSQQVTHVTDSTAMAIGEHKYSDAYFLNHSSTVYENKSTNEEEEVATKRHRVR